MGFIRKLQRLIQHDKFRRELDEELEFHLAMREELNVREGVDRSDARHNAARKFGNLTSVKERTGDVDSLVFLETVAKDVRFALRTLAQHPGFTITAVLALAVGIGVNTAVFTACKTILLQPLDAKNPRQLVNVYRTTQRIKYDRGFSYPDYEFFRTQNHVFSGLVASTNAQFTMTGYHGDVNGGVTSAGGLAAAFGFRMPSVITSGSQFVSVAGVSENYFAVLGVPALRGRVFLPQDASELEQHPAILISENFWERRFKRDPGVLGKNVKLNDASFTIIGITPHDFIGTMINVPNVWLPLRLWGLASGNSAALHDREDTSLAMYGRLNSGVSLQTAQNEMTLLEDHVRTLHSAHSEGAKTATISLTPGSHIGPVELWHDPGTLFALSLILGAVMLVLVIACANVSGLQLARSAARQKEIGIRLSIGAGRRRIIRQLLTESAVLGLIAGLVSLLLTWWALRLLMLQIAASLPMEWGSLALNVSPDSRVFAYVFLLSLVASVLFGLAPALQTSRPSLVSALREEGSGLAFRISQSRLRSLLLGTQAAASLFLLICAGLLIRGSIRSLTINPGFETRNTAAFEFAFPAGLAYDHAKQLVEMRQIRNSLTALPIVESVAIGIPPDAGGLRQAAVGIDGAKPSTESTARTLFYTFVSGNYFACIRMPLLSGTIFSDDSAKDKATAMISESAASELWPGQNPIGKKLELDASHQFHGKEDIIPQTTPYRIIGVVRDARAITPQGADNRKIFLSFPPDRLGEGVPLVVRFKGDPETAMANFGRLIRLIDPNLVAYAATLDVLMTSTPTFVMTRLAAIFASVIGGIGLLLACVGMYGSVSYAVTRRTREVGIRMALGAQRVNVLNLVLFESGRPVLVGLAIGIVAAAGAAQWLQALLFGLNALDPISFGIVGCLFFLVALVAAYVPARRATRVDAMTALRCE